MTPMRYLPALLLLASQALAQQPVEPQVTPTEVAEPPAAVEVAAEADAEIADQQVIEGQEYKLVDLLGGKDQFMDIQQQLVDTLLKANPDLAPYKATVNDWARRYISWDEMREGMASVYRDYFSPEEIEELLQFYRSDTGRKSIIMMPTLLRAGNQLGASLAEAHKPELVEMLRQSQP